MSIPFNKPLITGKELDNLEKAFDEVVSLKGTSSGPFISRCEKWMENLTDHSQVYTTTSGTAALEFAAMLADIQPGDEIIMPSYTYVSTMSAFVLRGGTCVFVDVHKETMNMDETLIEAAITSKTRAIVPVHYSSLPCEMTAIMALAERHNLLVIEDAACCLASSYKSRALGSIGHIGCFSFHATKPFTAGGQGGAIMVNSPKLFTRAEIIYENGTDRRQFNRGEVASYTTQGIGSNFQMSETAAACLWAQLDAVDAVVARRVAIWDAYDAALRPLADEGRLELPKLPKHTTKHNGGQYWILCKDEKQRGKFMAKMRRVGIETPFHFQPLHDSPLGRKCGRFVGEDRYTTDCSRRLVRLPLFYAMTDEEVERVAKRVSEFFGQDTPNGTINGVNGK